MWVQEEKRNRRTRSGSVNKYGDLSNFKQACLTHGTEGFHNWVGRIYLPFSKGIVSKQAYTRWVVEQELMGELGVLGVVPSHNLMTIHWGVVFAIPGKLEGLIIRYNTRATCYRS